jgi:fatty-acid desaturase
MKPDYICVVIGMVAVIAGLILVILTFQTEDLPVGMLALALMLGGHTSVTVGLTRLASRELLYGDWKDREGQKGGEE